MSRDNNKWPEDRDLVHWIRYIVQFKDVEGYWTEFDRYGRLDLAIYQVNKFHKSYEARILEEITDDVWYRSVDGEESRG